MIIGTLLVNATLLVASNIVVQNMRMEQMMHAHEMELEAMRAAEDELRKQEKELLQEAQRPNNDGPAVEEFPFAEKIPGKEGFVTSPYNKQAVDVRGIPSGTLVQDPTFPAAEKKYFRVP